MRDGARRHDGAGAATIRATRERGGRVTICYVARRDPSAGAVAATSERRSQRLPRLSARIRTWPTSSETWRQVCGSGGSNIRLEARARLGAAGHVDVRRVGRRDRRPRPARAARGRREIWAAARRRARRRRSSSSSRITSATSISSRGDTGRVRSGPDLFFRDDIPETVLEPIYPGSELPGGLVALYDGRGRTRRRCGCPSSAPWSSRTG